MASLPARKQGAETWLCGLEDGRGCGGLEQLNTKKTAHWVVGATGIEETAVISLVGRPKGPHLFSGVGDIGCFRKLSGIFRLHLA